MSKHNPDLVMCGKQTGNAIGKVGNHHDGQCVAWHCDSFVNPCEPAYICDECNYGSFAGRCLVTGEIGVADAYYCSECVALGRNRDGCPKVINLSQSRKDLFYERKKYGFKRR